GHVMHPDAIGRAANPSLIRHLLKLQIDERAALEVDPKRQAMPEEQRDQARDAEDQREAQEIPLLPQPVDIYFMKKFHALLRCLKSKVRHPEVAGGDRTIQNWLTMPALP